MSDIMGSGPEKEWFTTTYSRKGKIEKYESKKLGVKHEEIRKRAEAEGQWASTTRSTYRAGAMFTHTTQVASIGDDPATRAMQVQNRLRDMACEARTERQRLLESLPHLLFTGEIEKAKGAAADAQRLLAVATDYRNEAEAVHAADCLSLMKGDYYAAPVEAEGGAR